MFWGLIRITIFEAFYQAASSAQPMTLQSVVGYVWLGQAFILIQPWGVDGDVRAQIRSGAVAYELLRPLDLYNFWFSRAIAMKTAPTLLRSAPLITNRASVPGTARAPLTGVRTCLRNRNRGSRPVELGDHRNHDRLAAVDHLRRGISGLVPSVGFILSGMIVPLPLYPSWCQPILNILPFRHVADVPFRLYLGHLPPSAIWDVLILEAVWLAILVLGGRSLLAIARRRLVVQGG